MPKVEIGVAIFVHGEPRAIGDVLDLDSGTARYLIESGKATAVAEPKPEPEQPKPKPRRHAQPAPAPTEE